MKILKKLMLVATLATASIQGHSAEWSELDSIGNEFRLFYDPTSLHTIKQRFINRQYQQAWFKQEVVNDLNVSDNLGVGDYVLNLWRFECGQHKLGLVKSLYYKQTGQYISQTSTPYVLLSPLIPDTAGELMWKQVCLSPSQPLTAQGGQNSETAEGAAVVEAQVEQ